MSRTSIPPSLQIPAAVDDDQWGEKMFPSAESEKYDVSNAKRQVIHQFGDCGTTASVNRFGELLQFNHLVLEDGKTIAARAEARQLAALDTTLSWKDTEEASQNDSVKNIQGDNKSNTTEDVDDEMEADASPNADCLADYQPRYRGRVEMLSKLHMTPYSGFGLRLAPSYGKLMLKGTQYREDRWPEFDYTVKKSDINVNVQFSVENGHLMQQFRVSNMGDKAEIPVEIDLDFRAAMRQGIGAKIKLINQKLPDFKHSLTRDPQNKHYILTGLKQKMAIALFKDQRKIPPSTPDTFHIPSGSRDELFHRERVILQPKQAVTFTATYRIANIDSDISLTSPGLLEFSTSTERWWRFKEGARNSAQMYRRGLAHLVDVLARPLLEVSEPGSHQVWFIVDGDVAQITARCSGAVEPLRFLLGMYKLLRDKEMADPVTSQYYMKRIQEIARGVLLWAMKHRPLKNWDDVLKAEEHFVGSDGGIEERNADTAEAHGGSTEAEELTSSTQESQSADPLTTGLDSSPKDIPETGKEAAKEERDDEKEYDHFETDSDFVSFCYYITLLHQYAVLFPEDVEAVRECFEGNLPKFWEKVLQQRDTVSGFWPWVYQDAYTSLKEFRLLTQIAVWRAMDCIKKMGKMLAVPEDDTLPTFEGIADPQAFREKLIERFTVLSTVMAGGKQMTKVRVIALDRIGAVDSTELRDPLCLEYLIPSLNWRFFTKDEIAAPAWRETIRHQRWPTPEINVDKIGNDSDSWSYWAGNGKYLVDAVLAESLSRPKAERITARDQWDQYVSSFYPGGIIFAAVKLRCVEECDWGSMACLLHFDFAAEFDPKREETFARTHVFLDSKRMLSPTEGRFATSSEKRRSGQQPNTNLSEPADSRRVRGHSAESSTPAGDSDSVVRSGGSRTRHGVAMGSNMKLERINEDPDYGPPWLYNQPTFFLDQKYYRGYKEMKSFDDVKVRLIDTMSQRWNKQLWGTKIKEEMEDFYKRLKPESITAVSILANKRIINRMYQCGAKDTRTEEPFDDKIFPYLFTKARPISLQRHKIFQKEGLFSHLARAPIFTFLASSVEAWANYLSDFIIRLGNCTTDFTVTTTARNGGAHWRTEFVLSYIQIIDNDKIPHGASDDFFSTKRSPFLTSSSAKGPPKSLRESSRGFIFSGDLHDRYWTCYDFQNHDLIPERWFGLDYILNQTSSGYQRRVIELLLVIYAVGALIDNTKSILKEIQVLTGPGNADALFNQYSADDGSGEHAFQNRYKHSVVFPWVLELLSRLDKKCSDAENVLERVINMEKEWTLEPRWSRKDEKLHGEKIKTSATHLETLRSELKKITADIKDREAWISNMKEWIASDLSLQDARRSVILSESARVFTVVSVIFLPLSFSTSIVAVNGFSWRTPVKDLFSIIAIVSVGTLIILVNLDFIDQHFFSFVTRCHQFLRRMMVTNPYQQLEDGKAKLLETSDPESGLPVVKSTSTGPPTKFWEKKAQNLGIMDSRKALLGGQSSQIPETSDWWYWGFAFFFALVKLPMNEVAFTVRHFWCSVRGVGPLQKLIRMPWIFPWILLLIIVYIFIGLFSTIGLIWKLFGIGLEYGWKGHIDRPTNTQSKIPLWKKPLAIMEFQLVQGAYRARARKIPPMLAPRPEAAATDYPRKSSEGAENGIEGQEKSS